MLNTYQGNGPPEEVLTAYLVGDDVDNHTSKTSLMQSYGT
jgi:hypothetical protein